jgi:hypothetical protein
MEGLLGVKKHRTVVSEVQDSARDEARDADAVGEDVPVDAKQKGLNLSYFEPVDEGAVSMSCTTLGSFNEHFLGTCCANSPRSSSPSNCFQSSVKNSAYGSDRRTSLRPT